MKKSEPRSGTLTQAEYNQQISDKFKGVPMECLLWAMQQRFAVFPYWDALAREAKLRHLDMQSADIQAKIDALRPRLQAALDCLTDAPPKSLREADKNLRDFRFYRALSDKERSLQLELDGLWNQRELIWAIQHGVKA